MRNVLQTLILAGALAASASAVAAETREHDAHVHGTTSLDIALVGQVLTIDLYSPAMHIVGFERAPGNESQRASLTAALKDLHDATRVFHLTAAAGCRNVHSEATRVTAEEHGEHGDVDSGERHSEIRARYRFECSAPAGLQRIRVRLFELFPATESIRVQMLTDTTQRAMVLMPDNPDVPF